MSMKNKYIAVGDNLHIPSMTGTTIMETKDIAKLLNQINNLKALVSESFTEGHNAGYFKDVKRPVLSYWLESDCHLKLQRLEK